MLLPQLGRELLPDAAADSGPLLWHQRGKPIETPPALSRCPLTDDAGSGGSFPQIADPFRKPVGKPVADLLRKPRPEGGPDGIALLRRERFKADRKSVV